MAVFFKKSNHVLIQLESNNDWDAFFDCCQGFLTEEDYNRLHIYLKEDAKTVVIEKEYYDADYRNTYFNFFSHKFASYPHTTYRVNFFNKKIAPRMLFDLDRYQDDYIGFCVLRSNRVSSIGRSILNPKKLKEISGYICCAKYPVHILGAELIAEGFPYMSQDTDVTICAHAACWMLFRYFSQRYNRYKETWPYEVTQLTDDVSYGRLVPSKGLTVGQITQMFSKFGFYPESYFREVPDYKPIFNTLLYQYVESGLPVVAGLPGHAITLIGHVSDFDATKKCCHSDEFLTGYIINDDNYMPYQVLGKGKNKHSDHWSKFSIADIDSFVVPLYEKIHMSGEHVMKHVEAILSDSHLGIDACSKVLTNNEVVTRIFLTSSKSFKKVRRKDVLPFGISKVYAELSMPKFIWVCEISKRELFSRGKIVGELIFDATASQFDRLAFMAIHYPDFLLLNDRSYLTDDPKRFSVRSVDIDSAVPYHCYINNLVEV